MTNNLSSTFTPTPEANPAIVKPRDCGRCGGKGWGDWRVAQGLCMRCLGAGVVESDRATLAARKVRAANHRAAYDALSLEVSKRTGALRAEGVGFFKATEATRLIRTGFVQLETREPLRFTKAIDAILLGHPRVYDALAEYAAGLDD